MREFVEAFNHNDFFVSFNYEYCELREYNQAIEYYQQALAIYRKVNNRQKEAITLNNFGWVYEKLGDCRSSWFWYRDFTKELRKYNQAIEYYQQVSAIHREVNNRQKEAITLNNLGRVYEKLGDDCRSSWFCYRDFTKGLRKYNQAIEYYQQALAIHRKVNNRQKEAITLNNLGRVYEKLGDYCRELGDDCRSSWFCYRDFTKELRKYNQAIEYYQQALAIYHKVNNRQKEAITLNNLGRVYEELGEYGLAINYFQEALHIDKFKLNDDNFWERSGAVYLVGVSLIEAAIDPLIKCLYEDNYWVRICAAEGLKKIGTQATISKLINLLDNKKLAASGYNYVFNKTIINGLTVRCTNSSIMPTVCRQLSYFLDGLSTIIVRLLIGQLPFKHFSSLVFFDSS